jgi:hypothetical protein
VRPLERGLSRGDRQERERGTDQQRPPPFRRRESEPEQSPRAFGAPSSKRKRGEGKQNGDGDRGSFWCQQREPGRQYPSPG